MKLRFAQVAALAVLLAACGKSTEPESSKEAAPASAGQTAQSDAAVEAKESKGGQLVIYSSRKEHLIKPLFDAYSQATGTEIKFITDKAGALIARLESEGESTPADLLMTVDVGNLWNAQQKGILTGFESEAIEKSVPDYLRVIDQGWMGLTQRARVIVYASSRVKPEELSTYAALADEKWKGKLCLRTSKKVYNQSLVSSMIANKGEEQAGKMISGWVANLAVAPFSSDTKTLEAVKAGQCDVAVVNTYYYGRMEAANKQGDLKIFWSDQAEAENGVHMNISGAGLLKHAKHPQEAVKFLQWMVAAEQQQLLASLNYEFPVNPTVAADPMVQAWGEFRQDVLPMQKIAENQVQAIKLIDRQGYR